MRRRSQGSFRRTRFARQPKPELVPLVWNDQTLKWLDPIIRGEFNLRQSFGNEIMVYHTRKGFGITFPGGGHGYATTIARINFDKHEVRLAGSNAGTNPIVADAIILLNLIEQLRDFRVTADAGVDPETGERIAEDFGTVSEAAQSVGVAEHGADVYRDRRRDDRSRTGRYRYRVLKPLGKDEWYHVTRASALPSIMKLGLIPSETMRSLQGERGWTEFNLHLQNVVYLTADQDYAERIAETLAGRFRENAVILRVTCPLDPETLRIDEDALRTEFGMSNLGGRSSIPDFIQSIAHKMKSVGVARRIAPNCLKIVARLSAPVYEIDEDRDEAYLVGGLEWEEIK